MNDFKVDGESYMLDFNLTRCRVIKNIVTNDLDLHPFVGPENYESYRSIAVTRNEAIDAMIKHLEGLKDLSIS